MICKVDMDQRMKEETIIIELPRKTRNYFDKDNKGPKPTGDDLARGAFASAIRFNKIIEQIKAPGSNITFIDYNAEIAVLLALTCELFLKALNYNEDGNKTITTKPKEHNLQELFDKLPDWIKNDIIAEYYSIKGKKTDDAQFKLWLDLAKNVFIEFRYSFELPASILPYQFLIEFEEALRKICVKKFT